MRNKPPQPIYQKIKELILDNIVKGKWEPGTQIPSEAQLGQSFAVSRMTVRQALRDLQTGGYLEKVQGLGTFVSTPEAHLTTIKVENIAQLVREAGDDYSVKLLGAREKEATKVQARMLGIEKGDTLFRAQLLHFQNQQPVQLEDRLVNPACVPDFLNEGLENMSPFRYLMKVFPYPRGTHVIKSITPSKSEAKLLQLASDEPILQIERTTVVDSLIVTYVRLLHPGNSFAITGRIDPFLL